MKDLFFIAGRRKAGSTFLFHSIDVEWRAQSKDQSWSTLERDVIRFLESSAESGVIAKADALLDWDQILKVTRSSLLNVIVIVVGRDRTEQFLSFAGHERKKGFRELSHLANLFRDESNRFDVGVNSLLSNGVEILELDYEAISKGKLQPDLNFRLLPLERNFNSRANIMPFYSTLSQLVQSDFYQKFRTSVLLIQARALYYRFFVRRRGKNSFVNLWLVSVGLNSCDDFLAPNAKNYFGFNTKLFSIRNDLHFKFFLLFLKAHKRSGYLPFFTPDFIVFFISDIAQLRLVLELFEYRSSTRVPLFFCFGSKSVFYSERVLSFEELLALDIFETVETSGGLEDLGFSNLIFYKVDDQSRSLRCSLSDFHEGLGLDSLNKLEHFLISSALDDDEK